MSENPYFTMTGMSNNFNFSFWNTEKSDTLSMLMTMIESSANSIDRHQNYMEEIKYRLLLEDFISMMEICKTLLLNEKDAKYNKEEIGKSMEKIINEFSGLQEYLKNHNRDQLDRIEDKVDKLYNIKKMDKKEHKKDKKKRSK
jgi:hypothetical protein